MTTTKGFSTAKQCVVIRPKATNVAAFIYHGFADLKNLLQFVGSKPSIDEDGKLWFKKMQIFDNSVILRDAYGRVVEVLKYEDAETKYEIVADSEFKPEHANKIAEAPNKPAGKKGGNGNGLTRQDIVDQLKSKGIEFDARASKGELEKVLAGAKK